MSRTSQSYKQRRAAQLGMPIGTATSKLRLKVILDLLHELGRTDCSRCGKSIDTSDNLSVVHLEPWMDNNPFLFWKSDNIAFSHRDCPDEARQENKMNNNIVEINVINEHGEKLNHYSHDGKIWIAGKKNERYNIHIKNNSSDRVEIVCSVDGRDVVSGDQANYESQCGYLVNPYSSYTIEGWRQTNDKVAAFRFSAPGKSYSSKRGTPQNIGVLGMAVFREKRIISAPIVHIRSAGGGGGTFTSGGGGGFGSPGLFSNTLDLEAEPVYAAAAAPEAVPVVNINVSHTVARGQSGGQRTNKGCRRRRDAGRGMSRRITKTASPELGTEYGESVVSTVKKVEFTRANEHTPDQLLSIHYDSVRGLEKRGVNLSAPNGTQGPDPFPGVTVDPGYAPPA